MREKRNAQFLRLISGGILLAGVLSLCFAQNAEAKDGKSSFAIEKGYWSTMYAQRDWNSDTSSEGSGHFWTNDFYIRGRAFGRPTDLRVILDQFSTDSGNPRALEYDWHLRQVTLRHRGVISDDFRYDLVLGDATADVYDLATRLEIDYRDAGDFPVLRYVHVRGGDLIIHKGRISAQVVGGFCRGFDERGDDRYPRGVMGGRLHMQVTPRFGVGLQGAQVNDDLEEIQKMGSTALIRNAIFNRQLSYTMFYQPQSYWRLYSEGSMTSTDLDRSDGDNQKVQGEAIYLTSEYYKTTYGWTGVYQRLSPDFYVPGNYASSSGVAPITALVNDREKILASGWWNYKGRLDTLLRYNRWRNNLNNNPLASTLKSDQIYGNARVSFSNKMMPTFNVSGTYTNNDATTTAQYIGKDVNDKRLLLGLSHSAFKWLTWRHSSSFSWYEDARNSLQDKSSGTHLSSITIRPKQWVSFSVNHNYTRETSDTFVTQRTFEVMDYNLTLLPVQRLSISASYTTTKDEQQYHVGSSGSLVDNGYDNFLLYANYYYNKYRKNGDMISFTPYVSLYVGDGNVSSNDDKYVVASLTSSYRWATSSNEAYAMFRYRRDDRRGVDTMDYDNLEFQVRYTMNFDFTGKAKGGYSADKGGRISEPMADAQKKSGGKGLLNYPLAQDTKPKTTSAVISVPKQEAN